MKTIGWAALFLLLIHLLAAAGFVGWLAATHRIDRERLAQVVEVFELTIDQERAREQKAAQVTAAAQAVARKAARLRAVADGPQTFQDRLALEEQADELAIHRLERLQRETSDLHRQIERAKEFLTQQKAQLDEQRAAFKAFVEATTTRMQDEDFQQAVAMYEQLRPKQAKQMFQTLMDRGKTDEVVNYLAAMQLRKAAGVLKEFETPPEIQQATMLIQKLKGRGVYPINGPVAEASNP